MFLQWIPVVVRNAQRLRQAVPGVFTSALGLLLATGCFVPVSASAFIQTEPSLVGPGEPFRLVVQLGTTGPSGDPEPRVEIDGQEILVHVRLGLGGITGPPDVVLFTADVGPLPEGQYEVKILASLEGPGGTGVEVDSKQIDIGGPYVSASIEPEFAVADEPFELTLRGIASAPCLDEPPYLEDGVLVVPLILDCSVVTPPPPPAPFELQTPAVTLAAGTYPVVVGSWYSPFLYPFARSEIEVVPRPVALHDGLFTVAVGWEDFDGLTGDGLPARVPSDDSALFWFFGSDNWELMVKVLDACDFNGKYWVLGAASTTVAYDVEIQGPDSQTWTFSNPLGQPSEAFADVGAFDCVDLEPPPEPEPPADLPMGGGVSHLTIEPAQVVADLPARAVIEGTIPCCGAGVKAVHRMGRTVRVELVFSQGGILVFDHYRISADLGFLDSGTWDIQVVSEDFDGELLELARTTIEVASEVKTRTVPSRPMSDDDVRLFVTGFGTCPNLEVESVIGHKITALWSAGGCLSPPGIFELSKSLGQLEPGRYEVEVRTWSDERRLIGGAIFEVLGAPIALQDGRFTLDVDWRDFEDKTGRGRIVGEPSPDSALVWFFGPDNWELMVKVLEACDINGHYWVLGAASTTVEYDVTITDSVLGGEWTFHNGLGTASPAFADVWAFACD